MPGRPKRKPMRRYIRGSVQSTQVIAVPFVTKDVAEAVLAEIVNERTLISSLVATFTLTAVTPVIGQGPIMCGVSHSDYTAAEIEAWIENTGSWEQSDKISQEIARRKIREVGTIRSPEAGLATASMTLNEGKPITTKCNWQLTTGQTLRIWAYNMGSNPIATTVPILHINGHCNLWPN